MKLFDRSIVKLGGKDVEVPKLTIEKWEKLLDRIETLPQIMLSILDARQSSDFVATFIVGSRMALDETAQLVAAITDIDSAWVKKNADINELITFVTATIKKNNLSEAIKNFRALFALAAAGSGKSPSTNG